MVDDIFGLLDLPTANEVFSRLFGSDGLLRGPEKTAILATRSSLFLSIGESANTVMLTYSISSISSNSRPSLTY